MPKLVLLTPTLDRSGAEKQLALLATGLPREEFDVHVVALTRGGPYERVLSEAGVPVTILNKRLKCDPIAWWRLRKLLRRLDPEILHTWMFTANAYGRLAAGGTTRPPVVISERCVDTWKAGWQHWLDARLMPRAKRLIANSNSVGAYYEQRGFPRDRITVIRNGVEIADTPPADREQRLAEFDIPVEARVIGYVGRLARQKRVRDLVWGFQLLRQLADNVYMLILGDGPERSRLLEHARHYECEHLIRFAGHRDDANAFIPHLSVFWLASDFEGQSNSIMEAMAAGVPVVASDIPPNRELVVDGETGFVVQVGDSPGFAQFTERILADADLASRLGTAGRERMRAEFSVDAMVRGHVEVYRELSRHE